MTVGGEDPRRQDCSAVMSLAPPERHSLPLCDWIHGRASAHRGGVPLFFLTSLSTCPQLLHQRNTPKVTPGRGREPRASDLHQQLNCMVFAEIFYFFNSWLKPSKRFFVPYIF